MSEIQDTINQILSNPEAMRQVQSLGEQLGLSTNSAPQPTQQLAPQPAPQPQPVSPPVSQPQQNEMLGAMTSLAPLMSSFTANDEVSNLLNALRPFLGDEKLKRLDQAQRLMKLIKVIPLIKDSGLLF